jgi:hypothetical protein
MPRKEHAPVPDLIAAVTALAAVQDPELHVMKTHLVVERMLVDLLAVRLAVGDDDIPTTLSFSDLTEVALSGQQFHDLRGKVRALNQLRNYFGHELGASLISAAVERFVLVFGLVYLPHRELLDVGIKACCQQTAGEVLLTIDDVWEARGRVLDPSLKARHDSLRKDIAEKNKQAAQLRKQFKNFKLP